MSESASGMLTSPDAPPCFSWRGWRALMLGALAVFVLCIRWQQAAGVNSYITLDDQDLLWARFLALWHEGHWTLADLFLREDGPWRVVGLAWGLLGHWLNGGMWETAWQARMVGPWYALMVVTALALVADWRRPAWAWLVTMAAVGMAVFQAGWINTVASLGASEVAAVALQLVAMALWLRGPALGWRWWLGVLAWLLAGVSSDSGGLMALVCGVVMLTGMRGQGRQADRRPVWAGLILLALGLGWLVAGVSLGFWEWQETTGRAALLLPVRWLEQMSLPWVGTAWLAPVLWLPFIGLVRHHWGRWGDAQPLDRRLMTLGLWVMALACLAAIVKTTWPWSAVHYRDGLAMGALVNTACLARLMVLRPLPSLTLDTRRLAIVLLWMALLVLGHWWAAGDSQGWRQGLVNQNDRIQKRGMVIHGAMSMGHVSRLQQAEADASSMQEVRSWRWVQEALSQASLRAVLPPIMQPPMVPSVVEPQGKAFLPQADAQTPLLHDSLFGLSPRDDAGEAGRLRLVYTLPEGRRYYRVNSAVSVRRGQDLEVVVRSDGQRHVLWGMGHDIPAMEWIRYFFSKLNMRTQRDLAIDHGRLEIELNDAGTQKGGDILLLTPLAIGRGSYWFGKVVTPTLPWLFGLALAALLWTGGMTAWPTGTSPKQTQASGDCSGGRSGGHSGGQRWMPMAITLAVMAFIVFIRKSDAILNPQFWAEDGSIFFSGAYHRGWSSVWESYAGYTHLVPRLIACLVEMVMPYRWAPHAYNYAALLFMLGVGASLFSRRLPLETWQRVAMALTMVLVTHGAGEVYLNVTNIQWFGAILLLVTMFKASPHPQYGPLWRQWAWDLGVLVVIGLTGPFLVFLWPLYLVRGVAVRDRYGLVMGVTATVVAGIQFAQVALTSGSASLWVNTLPPGVSYAWLFAQLVSHRLVDDLFLWGILSGVVPALGCVAMAGVLAWIGWLAWRQPRQTRWGVAALMATGLIFLLATWARLRGELIYFAVSDSGARYLFVPLVMLVWSSILVLPARRGWQRAMMMALLACMLATSLTRPGFVSKPWPDLEWAAHARSIHEGTATEIQINPDLPAWKIVIKPKADTTDSSSSPPASPSP